MSRTKANLLGILSGFLFFATFYGVYWLQINQFWSVWICAIIFLVSDILIQGLLLKRCTSRHIKWIAIFVGLLFGAYGLYGYFIGLHGWQTAEGYGLSWSYAILSIYSSYLIGALILHEGVLTAIFIQKYKRERRQ